MGFKEEIRRLREIFKEKDINFVFSTIPLIAHYGHPALFAAKDLNIKNACYITSWDNLESKGGFPIYFDYYFCWNEIMKKELLNFYPYVKEEQVFIEGVPQFDYYYKKEMFLEKRDFFKLIGADENKKTVSWAVCEPSIFPNEDKIVENFYKNIQEEGLDKEIQLLLRAHPIGGVKRFENTIKKYPEIIPIEANEENPKNLIGWIPNLEDIKMLVNTLHHSDVTIDHCSTITIDSAILDKPIINISYDLDNGSKMERYIKDFYNFEYYRCVSEFKSAKIVNSQKELMNSLKYYLKNPELDKEGRKKLVNLQLPFQDCFSSKRIAERILSFL